MSLRPLDDELQALNQDLLSMAERVQEALARALEAVLHRDVACADNVLRADGSINRLEVAIDERCLRMLALYHPEAGELRLIAMAMKINNDLERIGDQAVNLAQRALELLQQPALRAPEVVFTPLTQRVEQIVAQTLQALQRRDVEMARAVCREDDVIDELDARMVRTLVELMQEHYRVIPTALRWILVCRHLERVADHATNIAEQIMYLVEGTTAKHRLNGTSAASTATLN
jgi:phosphate transport system protein